MTTLSAEVAEAVRLRDAATKGPWEIMGPWPTVTISTQPTDYDHETNSASGFSVIATMEEKTPGRSCNEHPDAALIAAARKRLIEKEPTMKIDVEELREKIDKASTHSAEETRFLAIMDAWDSGAISDREAAQRWEFLCRDLLVAIRALKP